MVRASLGIFPDALTLGKALGGPGGFGPAKLTCIGRHPLPGIVDAEADMVKPDAMAESARGISPRAAHRSGLDTLASSGSCHRAKAAAFH